jgi:putative redox protein
MATVTARLGKGVRVAISNGRHEWMSDEPVDAGGDDLGPTPYEMLAGSLAACTALTLRLYAAHKGIALESVTAEYSFDRVHAVDCEECTSADSGMIERMRARITIGGTFTEPERKRLAEIAARCPVHKTLTHGIRIFDEVIFEGESRS